jgi:carbon storage regulator CsrA
MLVLSRRLNESVTLTDHATGKVIGIVVVSKIDHNQVRIGFELPRDIDVMRTELIGKPREPR